jgi:hypothetical protein
MIGKTNRYFESWIVERSLRPPHPIEHAPARRIGCAQMVRVYAWIGANCFQQIHGRLEWLPVTEV